MIVIDTSVLFDAVVDGARSSAARAAMSEFEVVSAPDLILYEVANALTRAVRRKDITADFARTAHDFAKGLVPTESSASEISRAFELSIQLVHPFADCVFLAFAERRGARLATCDAHFARKLSGTSFSRLLHLIEA
ncbi:MAG: type II toxin-antitoxin system VapC family toxin [Beijerinckiaceae bacterium]|nr:type II toxin-antitoxin system VapC family toxin [Beijerinckiaceae bacterium]